MTQARTSEERKALLALLDYYRALGVDCALEEAPCDRYAESAREPAAPPPAPAPTPTLQQATTLRAPAAPIAPQEAERAAEAIAAAARTLDELRQSLAAFESGGAIIKARRFLFSAGAPSPLMALEYAPGEAEENGGAPFCGPEARLLGAMLAAIGHNFESAYCAYFSPWRPPGGQRLAPHANAVLAPFARRHIELARPKAVLLLGDCAKSLLRADGTPASLYARRFDLRVGEATVAAIPAPGLAAMLKAGALKAHAWRALRLVAAALEQA